ncbi:hypothetical protein SLE2022_101910 [Rubroshorea leprosula]
MQDLGGSFGFKKTRWVTREFRLESKDGVFSKGLMPDSFSVFTIIAASSWFDDIDEGLVCRNLLNASKSRRVAMVNTVTASALYTHHHTTCRSASALTVVVVPMWAGGGGVC